MSPKAPPPTATATIPFKDSTQSKYRSYSKRTRQTTVYQTQSNNKSYPVCQRIPSSHITPVLSVCGCCLLRLRTQMQSGALSGSWPRLQMLEDRFRSGCSGVGRWVECPRLLWRMWVCFWGGLIRRDLLEQFQAVVLIPLFYIYQFAEIHDFGGDHKQRIPGPTLPVSKISTSPAPSASSRIQRKPIPLNSFHFLVLPGSTPLNSPLMRLATLKLRFDSTAPSQRSRRRVSGASWYLDCFNKASRCERAELRRRK